MKKSLLFVAILVFATTGPFVASAGEVNVAVAANFLSAAKKISDTFENKTGHKIILSAGSTGQLYSQIRNGAPYDFFFAADSERPAKLEAEGFVSHGTRFEYALGGVALYSSTPGYVDSKGEVLQKKKFKKLAIANPKIAPYGKAGVEILDKMGLLKSLSGKLIYGQSVAQTFQFVASGAAEIGFVAMSQVREMGDKLKGSYWVVDRSFYTPIKQEAVLLKHGETKEAAVAFMQFTKSARVGKLIENLGYSLP